MGFVVFRFVCDALENFCTYRRNIYIFPKTTEPILEKKNGLNGKTGCSSMCLHISSLFPFTSRSTAFESFNRGFVGIFVLNFSFSQILNA